MSGFEVVGIVLGSIPLLISAIEAYSKFMRDWGEAPRELRSLNRRLTTEEARLRNVCYLLINDVVPQQDIEPMLSNPFGPLWQIEETNDKIRRRLWDVYKPFEDTVIDIKEAFESITQRLRVEISRDGQVEWVNQRRVNKEFKKLLYRVKRDDYKDDLKDISEGISHLQDLAKESIPFEPLRRKQSRGKLYKILRDLSTSIYRALCSSILCNDSHDVSLELTPQFIEMGYEAEDEKVLKDAQFKVAISFEMIEGLATKRFWDEINIKTATSSAVIPPKQPLTELKTKSSKRVSFGPRPTFSFMDSVKSAYDIKSAMATSSRAATDIAFIKTYHEDGPGVKPPLNLCAAIRKGLSSRPACYGHLSDTEYTDRHFQVYTLGTATNSDNWSIVTLDDILKGKRALQPLVSLAEKVQLALAIASSVLQLSKTPWLPEVLTRRNVHFFRRDDSFSYNYPFLVRAFPASPPKASEVTSTFLKPGCIPSNNPTLFALGILLLEIILGSTFERLRPSEKKGFDFDDSGILRDWMAAHELLEQRVALINPVYKDVVQLCIDCDDSKSLDHDGFREKVYNGVVMPLEAICESTKLGV
ncbi:hypothetical protein ACHAPJ_007029 [Fusarium lateritium]